MPIKYHVHTVETPARFEPVPKYSAMEKEGCLGCRECVKRESCVFDVYEKRTFNPSQVVDTADVLCISCMRCVQECKKNILSRTPNPQYTRMGDSYWKPDMIASIWKQALTGKIPVSGAGYRGPFTGPGFDQMWTDMSEIVRPTRDGIHGREYISTVIELGRRPGRLEFDDAQNLLTPIPPFAEIPLPMILDMPACHFIGADVREAVAAAAAALQTFVVMPLPDAGKAAASRDRIILSFDPARDKAADLKGGTMVQIAYSDKVIDTFKAVKAADPGIIVSIRVPLDEHAAERAVTLAQAGAEVLHFEAARDGNGLGAEADTFVIKLIQAVHFRLLEESLRDTVTVLVTGGLAAAEHIPKLIGCGADGVGIDYAWLAALECRLCPDCADRQVCPVAIDTAPAAWAAQRIVNLLGAWQSQLIEVMGAMGLREVRRLRGELGRCMFFDDLERDNFGPVFGKRIRGLEESLAAAAVEMAEPRPSDVPMARSFPADKARAADCPSHYRNSMGVYKVERTSACIACGQCAEVCQFGVHIKAGGRMLAPKSHLCRGLDVCRGTDNFCVNHCPTEAIRVGLDPMWQAFGDPRWTAELLSSTWKQAETGYPPDHMEYRKGASGGGFDRINFRFPDKAPDTSFKPEDVDLSVRLNRRTDDGRPDVTIGIPFYGGGMSFGSISKETMLARAKAYNDYNSFTCTGEGGYPEDLKQYDNAVITQVATGLFGVMEDTIQRVRMVEFKYAQGAKPGLGGHLLGDKVTPAVALMREAVVGNALFSPFPFHSVYSVEDHKKHVDWIKHINPRALVSVKVSGASDVDMVAVGSYYAGAHVIHLDGSYGGTGAAPDIAKKNIAMPIEYATPKVHQFLEAEGVRDAITVVASGGARSAWDVAKLIALGADAVVIGTAEVVALECIRCGACESGRGCPRGIATTDPELSLLFDGAWAYQRLVNLFHSWSIQLQGILWRLGLKSVRDLVGRTDLLEHRDYDNQR